MIGLIEVRERGATPGLTKRVFSKHSKTAWFKAALFDHEEHSQDPFTEEFRKAGGFPARRGQNLSPSSKAFNRSYYGRKLRSKTRGGGPGLALPNVNTGESRRRAKFVRTTATSKGLTNRYGVPALNFKNARSRVHPAVEFRTRLPRQAQATANQYDNSLDDLIDRDTTTKTTAVR